MASAIWGTLEACFNRPVLPAIRSGAQKAEYLPERKIPRHHRQHRADRPIANEAGAHARGDGLVGQQSFAILNVITATARALDRFVDGRFQRLAHFESHEPPEFVLLSFQNLSGAGHPASAIPKRCVPIALERRG